MGSEVDHRFFVGEDFSVFRERLDSETELLGTLFENDAFSPRGNVCGFELEAWLVDAAGRPLPENARFLDRLRNPLVVPELARFNIELNGSPTALTGRVFSRLHDELSATWQDCLTAAAALGQRLVMIGTLPTAEESMFDSANMSEMIRYRSLNDRIMALRDGQPLQLHIEGDDSLALTHDDVMLEAAATSFQIHLQVRPHEAVRDFNASLIAAAPLVAVAANSPMLFGHLLWEESRIALFEQAVDLGPRHPPRVTFGTGYVRDSLFEIFHENATAHPILLPVVQDAAPEKLAHLRFQNGTLWRWVRPLVGFDFDGLVHLRIEQRVAAAGPTLTDCIANAALYFGLVRGLGLMKKPPENQLPFEVACENLYKAARYGLGARLDWFGEGGPQQSGARALLQDVLLPIARRGLAHAGVPDDDIARYLGIIAARVDNGQNGAAWQRRWRTLHGGPLRDLVDAYRERQDTDAPVHSWSL